MEAFVPGKLFQPSLMFLLGLFVSYEEKEVFE
jgi:hypothetical protein